MPLEENSGKVWASDDSEPGELPIYQSPFSPTSDGEGIIGAIYPSRLYIFMPGFMFYWMDVFHNMTLPVNLMGGFLLLSDGFLAF